eukprot:9519479-Alexandrium_andersonii.AAC.1
MSASLVGSEMCIRDRPPTRGCELPAQRWLGRLSLQPPPHETTRPRAHTCLLYTSDAADDM